MPVRNISGQSRQSYLSFGFSGHLSKTNYECTRKSINENKTLSMLLDYNAFFVQKSFALLCPHIFANTQFFKKLQFY